jgi:Mg2+/Co2+ transporter CorB
MEIIPQTGTSLMIDNYTIEITRTTNNAVQTARLRNTREETASENNKETLNT